MSKKLHNHASAMLPMLLLLMLLTLMPAQLSARDFHYTYEGQTLTYEIIDEEAMTVMVVKGSEDICDDLVIPHEASDGENQYTVVSIGNRAFMDNYDLTSVIIPNSVTSIGNETFRGCVSLTSANIPNTVTSINDCTFYRCFSLRSINIPNSVTSIGSGAFEFCSGLTSVIIPNSVTAIGSDAFKFCTALTSVSFSSFIESVGDNALNFCALTEVILPPHVKTIGDYAFANNEIKSIAIGSEVTKIGENAFASANQLGGISITALTPPVAGSNTFSNYDCPLYVMPSANDEVKNAYANDANCWSRFTACRELVPAERVEIEGKDVISLHPGETVALSAAVVPADASLPYIFWRSTHPSFATVDNEGNVTLVDNGGSSVLSDESCEIIAETLYANVFARIKVKDANTEIEDIAIDGPAPTNDIFTLQGICVKRNASQADIDALTPGLYIVAGRKVLVK